MVYVRLKDLRNDQGDMSQAELADVLGVNQSTLSRMESMSRPLLDSQYEKLVARLGEDYVAQFIMNESIMNAVTKSEPRRIRLMRNELLSDRVLAEVVKAQQEEIARLNARIAELTDRLLEK